MSWPHFRVGTTGLKKHSRLKKITLPSLKPQAFLKYLIPLNLQCGCATILDICLLSFCLVQCLFLIPVDSTIDGMIQNVGNNFKNPFLIGCSVFAKAGQAPTSTKEM